MNEVGKLHVPFKAYLKKIGLPFDYSKTHKRTTSTPGQPDFSVYKGGRVFFVEFKDLGGKLSDDQEKRILELKAAGNQVCVCYDLQHAVDLLDYWRHNIL